MAVIRLRFFSLCQAGLPFVAFLSGVEQIVKIACYEDLRCKNTITIPGPGLCRRNKDGIVWICLEAAEVERPDVPYPPGFTIVSAIKDVEISRPLKYLGLTDSATVPGLSCSFENWISRVFSDVRRIGDRCSCVTDNRGLFRLTRIDDMDCLANDSNGRMGGAVLLVLGFNRYNRFRAQAPPFTEIPFLNQQARLLGHPTSSSKIVGIIGAVGRVPKWERVFGRGVVETVRGRQKDGIARDIVSEGGRGYDLIIMGRKGISGVKDFFLGSITQKVINMAKDLSVLIVH